MKNKILVVVLVLFFCSVFVSSGLADLYIINDKEGKNVCITNINTEISKYQALGYELILIPPSNLKLTFLPTLKEGEIMQTGAAEAKETEIMQSPGEKIKIVDWTNYIDGNYYYVEGILKNVSKVKVKYAQVIVIAYDSAKKLVTLKESYANPYDLAPGQEATFRVMIKYNSRIEGFGLRVNWKED
ncbi:hypothetical protein ES705_11270 [subsurface metagenome]